MNERFKICCAVHLIIINDGKILLQKRNNPNKHGYGTLGMPAGHLEPGENIYEALKREAKEEIDIDVIESKVVQVMNLNGDTDVYDAYFFTCKYTGEIKNMEEENAKSLEWHDIDKPIENLMPYQQYALSEFLENPDNIITTFGWN